MDSSQINPKRSKKPRIDEGYACVTAPTPNIGADTASAQQLARYHDTDGKLRNMMKIPIDIFAEVCSYLEPLDIRHLALASKGIRSILMTRKARYIWNAVLSSIPGLPKCPSDLNEPRYVRFPFSTECDTTGCDEIATLINWFYRLRFCEKCFDRRMINESSIELIWGNPRYQSGSNELTEYFNRFPVTGLITGDERHSIQSHLYEKPKHFYEKDVKNTIETYKALLQEQDHELRVRAYMRRLHGQRNYRAVTGSAMRLWHFRHLYSQQKEVDARQTARLDCVMEKLAEDGWGLVDFPRCKEFWSPILLYYHFTPEIWEAHKPSLIHLLLLEQESRLEMEIIARKDQRHDDVEILYLQTASEILSLPRHLVKPYIPSQDLINSLPKVQEMLEADTETIAEEQWMGVVEEVRTVIRRHCGNILRQLVALVETGEPTPPVELENAVEGEEIETTTEDIDAMVAKLALVTASFVCKPSAYACGTVHWFPVMLLHWVPSCGDFAVDISPLLKYCEPLDDEGKRLVRRMLGDLGLDPVNATEAEVTSLKNLICARCDHNIANYASFGQIVHHYILAQTWFSAVQRAKQISSHSQYVTNDHDWLLDNTPLVRQDSDEEKASLDLLQAEFLLQAATDPAYDIEGVGGEELRQNLAYREIKRSCNLCPNGLGPRPCSTSMIKIHILAKHGKEPDLDTDTNRQLLWGQHPCPT